MDSFFEIFGMYRYPLTVASEPMKEKENTEDALPSGLNLSDDSLWFTHEFTDETSQFDDHPTTRFNGEGYSRKFRIRAPIAFRNSKKMLDEWVSWANDYCPCNGYLWPD